MVLAAGPGSGGRFEDLKFGSLGESYLEQARVWLRTGERALKEGNYAFVVLAAQECVEFSLKGLLKKHGIEYPRTHDTGLVLAANKDRLPKDLASKLEWVREVSRSLAMKRSLAAYGNEAGGIPAGRLFDRASGESALRDASTVLTLCSRSASLNPRTRGRRERKGPTAEAQIRRMRRKRFENASGR